MTTILFILACGLSVAAGWHLRGKYDDEWYELDLDDDLQARLDEED